MQIAVIVLASVVGELVLGVGLGSLLRRGSAGYPVAVEVADPRSA